MVETKEMVCLTRDCMALMVPSGARIMLHKDTEVMITQSLGNSFTVNVYGNLARIDAKDADAIGKEIADPFADMDDELSLEDKIWIQLKNVYDPEIPVNIVDLGLIYGCEVSDKDDQLFVLIKMTLTAPGCGMGPVITEDARERVLMIPEVENVEVELVFDPPWDQSMMSEEAKLELGML